MKLHRYKTNNIAMLFILEIEISIKLYVMMEQLD